MNDSLYEEYMRNVLGYEMLQQDSRQTNIELENCYPDIYNLVYPMVQKACMQSNRPMTRENIESMTNEIYFSIESEERGEDEKENRQVIRNQGLNDLIRILILREILGRPNFPPPPPGRPPRPPMRPPRPGMRYLYEDRYDNFFE